MFSAAQVVATIFHGLRISAARREHPVLKTQFSVASEGHMNMSKDERNKPLARAAHISESTLNVDLVDGTTISAPTTWFPRLSHASTTERNNWRLVGKGVGIHWPDLDEDISIAGLLAGSKSGESSQSFKQWLSSR